MRQIHHYDQHAPCVEVSTAIGTCLATKSAGKFSTAVGMGLATYSADMVNTMIGTCLATNPKPEVNQLSNAPSAYSADFSPGFLSFKNLKLVSRNKMAEIIITTPI